MGADLGSEGAGRRNPAALLLLGWLLASALAAILGAAAYGSHSRVAGPALARPGRPMVVRARDAAELQALRRDLDGRGRIVVSVSGHVHFMPAEGDAAWRGADSFPLRVVDVAPIVERQIDVTNHLRVAVRTGIFREIVHVVTPAGFAARRAVASSSATDVVSMAEHAITLHEWGSRRTITDRVPSIPEPVVLELDASWFEEGDGAVLAAQLDAVGLRPEVVALAFAEDDPEVTPRGREALAAFGARFESGRSDAR